MQVLAPIARALAATHAAQAVHRDVKGDNMLVRPGDGYPMLLDFGAGDFRGAPTLTHEVLPPGTPDYRSPQAALFLWRHRGKTGARYEPGPADDLYAFGVTLYRLVTGTYPLMRVPTELRLQEPSLPVSQYEPPETWVTLGPELARIIRQLLSEQPSERGSAEQVAQALEEAVRTAGPHADEPIVRRPVEAPAVRESRPSPSRPAWAGWPWLSAAAGLAATAGLATTLVLHSPGHSEPQAPSWPPEESSRPVQAEDKEDAGVSLAREALMVSAHEEQPEPDWVARALPKEPLPGQQRAPCRGEGQIELNGGCWRRLIETPPSCGEDAYEWKRACYYPVPERARPRTSKQPR
jgi:serine/threonine protein kinase